MWLLSWALVLGFFVVSIKRGIKKSGKLLDLIHILGFSQELKDGILYCISIFLSLGGNKIIHRSI